MSSLPIVAAFPNAFLAVLVDDADFPARPARARQWTDHLFKLPAVQRALEIQVHDLTETTSSAGRIGAVRGHDRIASFVCALTALSAARRDYVAVGDRGLGHIFLSPTRYWGRSRQSDQPWALDQLQQNLIRVQNETRFSDLTPELIRLDEA